MTWRDLINTGKPFVVSDIVYWVCGEFFYYEMPSGVVDSVRFPKDSRDLDRTVDGDLDWFENAKPHSNCMCPLSAFGIVHFDGCSRL